MKSKTLLSSLALTCFVASAGSSVVQAGDGFKCYGIAEAGDNDCDALDHNEHTCGGASKRDKHPGDWKVVESEDTCKKEGGLSEAEARKKLKLSPF